MQNTSDVLGLLEGEGLSFSISRPGQLMVVPRERITPSLRSLIMERKADILAILAQRAKPDPLQGIPSKKEQKMGKAAKKAGDGTKGVRRSKLQHSAPSVALTWLNEHRTRLKAAGWTGRELYRRNKSKGLLWMSIWGRPNLQISITPHGIIEFWFAEHRKMVRQTARPIYNNRFRDKGDRNEE